jgi:hypothetical protein
MRLAWVALLFAGCEFSNSLTPGDGGVEPNVGFERSSSVEDEASNVVMVPVTLDADASGTVTVDYTISDGSAKRGEDYTATNGTLTWNVGERVQFVPVTIINDGVEEGDETIELRLRNAKGAKLGIDEHTLGINSDILPRVRFIVQQSNGPESEPAVQLAIELDVASPNEVKVDYALSGLATAADYNLAAGTVVFPAGTTTRMIDLAPIDDALDEDPEDVVVTLTNPIDAIVKPLEGVRTHTLTDNDATPTIRFTQASSQTMEGTATVTLTMQLSAVSGRTVTVPFTGAAASVNGASAADYTFTTASPLVIPAGTQMMNVVVTIVDDTLDEFIESFTTTIGTPTNADLAPTQTAYTLAIDDNDNPPSVMWDPNEADGAAAENMDPKYKLVLSTASGKPITVPINFSGTASDVGVVDYAPEGVPVTFAPGDTTKTVTLDVVNDVLIEGDETVIMTIPNNGSLTDVTRGSPFTRTHTIMD